MTPENLAVIITISILGGVVFIALVAACITMCVTNNKVKKKFASTQPYRDMVAQPSYVRYPAPEPYTATHHIPEDDPWRTGGYENEPAMQEEHNPHVEDILDHSTSLGRPAPQDIPRRPSHVQALPYRRSSVQNLPRRSSYVPDLPRKPSYAPGMPRRASYAQAMPRSRHSYAPDIPRRPSNAQAFQRRPHSYNPTQESSSGQHSKLWYNYLKEEPDYFTHDGLEWNRRQSRVWSEGGGRNTPSLAPHHAPLRRRESELRQVPHYQNHHQAAASRLSWI